MSNMQPSAEERMDRAHLDHGQWLAKDVDKVLTLIREAYADGLAAKQAECDALQNLADKNTILIEAIEAKYTALQHKIDASPVAWLNGEWFHTVPVEPKDRA